MIVARRLKIHQKNDIISEYINLTQIYTIGNFITVTGMLHINSTIGDEYRPSTDKYIIADLERMEVEF